MLSHIRNWVDAGARGFYASAMRAPTHMRFPWDSQHFSTTHPILVSSQSSSGPFFELVLFMCILKWFLWRPTLFIGAPLARSAAWERSSAQP